MPARDIAVGVGALKCEARKRPIPRIRIRLRGGADEAPKGAENQYYLHQHRTDRQPPKGCLSCLLLRLLLTGNCRHL